MTNELLDKFLQAPGLMAKEEILEVESFLIKLDEDVKMFSKSYGPSPYGQTFLSLLDTLNYYKEREQ